ncbi:telomerase protein component 1-like isoform X1 [Biomphalaria glabrata]|uniref:Telomerase protein component 1-like isoform X1 n=1 Tax=Biomphalaria glabrata TaxID=6526 RepID=A0A9W2ZHN1_BIOGL|nr:telomerase protein component 1-like isoform X1 [Biomphalaria glabrata]XP_055874451.1 telomerase protein component 1-like isoform X1 [Biomphalaria glabrata]XP_055874452.1 telomerase protein component 1-like isoform X1 [Biomphalaria glabrata]
MSVNKNLNPLLDKKSKNDITSGGLSLTSSLLTGQSLLAKFDTSTRTFKTENQSLLSTNSSKLLATGSSTLLSTGSLKLLTTGSSALLTTSLNNPLLSTCSTLSPLSSDKPLLSSQKTVNTEAKRSPLSKPPHLESGLKKLTLASVKECPQPSHSVSEVSHFKETKLMPESNDKKSLSKKRLLGSSLQTEKKVKLVSRSGEVMSQSLKQYAVEAPDYYIKYEKEDEFMEFELPQFVLPTKDMRLTHSVGKSLVDITGIKRGLINCVSGSLISQPNFAIPWDKTREQITAQALAVIPYDPEFILKVALYSRKELNIRTTSNFLLALAASDTSCRVFVKKYFCISVALPSDWIEVAELFQTLVDKTLKPGALPAALRKAMISKFPEFDKYQLAKYNKESSGKKKKSKAKKLEDQTKSKNKNQKQSKEQQKSEMDHRRGDRKGKHKKRGFFDSDSSDSEDEGTSALRHLNVLYDDTESFEELRKQKFTIKQLIRKLHIREPVEHVMCIIGKKYPNTMEEFYKSRLPGTWEEERAGKRMKLPIPETWETQVSLKGNKAKTWEDLIDHKKLPYMAMLRNLRNLIKAGISSKHHNFVLKRLCDQKSVVNSKQFPFRFFSAYFVLTELEEAYENNQREIIQAAEAQASTEAVGGFSSSSRGGTRGRGLRGRGSGRGRGGGSGRGGLGVVRGRVLKTSKRGGARGRGSSSKSGDEFPWWLLKKMKKEAKEGIKEVPYDKNLLQRYKKSLDTAVKVATVHNVQPIKGWTVLLCDIGENMDQPCSSAKGLGKPRTLKEISVLMGLMCKYSCEQCEMLVFSETGFQIVELQKGTILDNMDVVLKAQITNSQNEMVEGIPYDVLLEKLRDRIQIDNLLIFGEDFYPYTSKGHLIGDFLRNYRHLVNPDLLYVSVTFSGSKAGFVMNIHPEHDNDVYISGYSDSILRFIAERGDAAMVNHVDRIDAAYQLVQMSKCKVKQQEDKPLVLPRANTFQLTPPIPSWRTIRVFISSTFRDMHGERDLLTRFIFPELRSLFQKRFINIHEVDLRWGLTEEDTKDNRTLDICLKEVLRCDLFIGLLGERYGWTPSYVPDSPEFDWVHSYPAGASVTELEIHLGALSKVEQARDTAFFFFRDSTFEKDIPKAFEYDFKSESELHKSKVTVLKKKIKNSGLEVFDNYPCHWGGCVDDKPIVAGLDQFGARVLNNLINAVNKLCPEQEEAITEEDHVNNLQWAFVENCSTEFVGRRQLVHQIVAKINSKDSGILGVVGKSGSGKTALMSAAIMQYSKCKNVNRSLNVFINIAGSAPGSTSLIATLRRLAQQINKTFGLGYTLPEDFKNVVLKLREILEEAASLCSSRLVIFLDSLDMMDSANQPCSLEWLPLPIPDNVVIVISATEGEKTHKSLKRLSLEEINIGGLDMWDKAELVRNTLAKHRKSLDESGFSNQMKLLMLKKDAHNPLYLKLACEELRVFGVFERISDKLKSLPQTTAQMLQEILSRLEQDHGKELVSVSLSLLACVRDGLYPEELHELLSWHRILGSEKFEPLDLCNRNLEIKDFLPPLVFSFLFRSIMSLLNPSATWSPVLGLANQEICTAVRLRYFKNTDISLESNFHKLLAGYFMKQADPLKDNSWHSHNTKAFSELPFHLANGGNFHELENVLCNHKFIQTKCSLGLATKLMEDFTPKVSAGSKVLEKSLSRFLSQPRVEEYKSFISRNIEVLVSYPSLEWQQALNEPSESIPCKDAESLGISETPTPHMVWLNKPEVVSQCFLTLSNFKLPVTSIAISPDSTKFATGSEDLLVRLYDMATGKELRFFTGHSDEVSDVCFVGNNQLCSGSVDTILCLWDIEHGHRLQTLKGHGRKVSSCASDRQGKLIVSGGLDCFVFVWRAASGEKLCDFNIGSPVNCVDFHPNEEQIVVGSWDSLIRIYNYFHKTRIAILRGHSTSVRDIAYSVDGRHLASASLDGDIKIWAADKGSQVGNVKGHCGPISKLAFSPSGKELVTAGEDHQIKVWSGELGIPLHKLPTTPLGAAVSVAIAPDGHTVAVGYHLGAVRLYDLNTGVKMFEVKLTPCAVRALTFSKNGNYILSGSDDAIVQVFENGQGSKVCTLVGHSKAVLCLYTSKSYVASGGEDFTCCIYEDIQRLKSSKKAEPHIVLKGHIGPVTSCCINDEESLLATASRDASIRIYNLRDIFITSDPQPSQTIDACHADWINAAQWSNTGQFLVTASNDFNLKLWDVKSGTEKLLLSGHTSAVNCVAFKYGCIVSGSSDGQLKVWSHKGVSITTLFGHSLRVNACDMYVKIKSKDSDEEDGLEKSWAEIAMETEDEGSDGKKPVKKGDINMQDVIVASAGDDGEVWIWRPLQANSLACLTGHSNRVLSVDIDKHCHIASSSLDHSVRLWQPSFIKVNSSVKHDSPVTFLSVLGNLALSGSRDGVVKIWKKDSENKFQLQHSYQAHEKSVNCGSFDSYSGDKFWTGGDDNYVYLWEIIDRKDGFFVRKRHFYNTDMPVAALASTRNPGQFIYTTWSGAIFLYDKAPKFLYSIKWNHQSARRGALVAVNKWAQSLLVRQDEPDHFIIGSNCNELLSLQLESNSTEAVVNSKVTISAEETDRNDVKKPPNWVNAIAYSNGLTFAGDSNGQIFLTGLGYKMTVKIHRSAITSVQVSEPLLITCSLDSTIKVWNFKYHDDFYMNQVGQFFCPAPIWSLQIAHVISKGDKKNIFLLAGDQHGNIHQLLWKS